MLSACSQKETKGNSTKPYIHSAQLITISPSESYVIKREYIGKIATKQYANISFEYRGKIDNVFVDDGDIVKKGQILAQQDTELLSIQLAQLKARIEQKKAQQELNTANLTRINTLDSQGYSAKKNLDELNAQQKIYRAQLQELQASQQALNYQISKAQLLAPFDAVVGQRMLSQGEYINAGVTTFRLIEQEHTEITLGVPRKIAKDLTIGQIFPVTIGNKNSQAKLIAIGQQLDAINRTVQLRLTLIEQIKNFNGDLARITINKNIAQSGYWLPLNAITDGVRGQWNIYLAQNNTSEQYQLASTTIQLLHTTENHVFIKGLPKGKHIILADGLHRYVPGQIVKAIPKYLEQEVSAL